MGGVIKLAHPAQAQIHGLPTLKCAHKDLISGEAPVQRGAVYNTDYHLFHHYTETKSFTDRSVATPE